MVAFVRTGLTVQNFVDRTTQFKIKSSEKIRRFDLAEIIFKLKKVNKIFHIRRFTRENIKSTNAMWTTRLA